MRWAVIRHPELGAAIVGEDSLPVHAARGWVRTSPLVDDQYSLNIADHPLPEPAEPAEQDATSDEAAAEHATQDPTPTRRAAGRARSTSTED